MNFSIPTGPRPTPSYSGPPYPGPAPAGDSDMFDFNGTFDPRADVPVAGPKYEKLMSDFTKEFYIPDEDGSDTQADPASPTAVELPEIDTEPAPVPPAGISTKITGGALGILFIICCIAGGFGTGLFVVGVFILLTALYTITTGRGSWARLASRKLIAAAIGAALALFLLCAVISPQHREDSGPKPTDSTQTTKAPAPKPKK